jgi:hypothetical protein
MSSAMRFQTRVLPGHRIEVSTPGLSEGAPVDVLVVPTGEPATGPSSRRDLLQMPVEERRQLLIQQAGRLAAHYDDEDVERTDWQGGDIVE